MSGVYMQTIAHIALTFALVMGVAAGWIFADVIEFLWRKHP